MKGRIAASSHLCDMFHFNSEVGEVEQLSSSGGGGLNFDSDS